MKLKYSILLPLLILVSATLHAQQWQKYADLPLNLYPVDVASNNEGYLFLLTKNSQVYWKAPGSSWQKMPMPTYGLLLNAPCIGVDKNSNTLYVGSLDLGIFYTSDFGNTWGNTFFTTNPVSGFHEGYVDIATTNNSNLVFAASLDVAGAIAKFTNQGATGQFITYSTSIQEVAQTVYYTSNNNLLIGTSDGIWFSGDNGNTILETSFDQQSILKFAEDNTGRVYALILNTITEVMSLIYSDDYQNWNNLNLPNNTEEYTTISYDNSTNALWLGSKNNIYKTGLNTIAWQNSNLNNTDPFSLKITTNNNNGRLLCLTTQNILQELDPQTNSWNNISEGLTGEANRISMTKDGKVLVAEQVGSNKISALLSHPDNWNNVVMDDLPGVRKIAVDTNGKVFSQAVRNIFVSDDNALTFEPINLPTAFNGLPGLGGTSMYVGEQNGLFLTRDNISVNTRVWGSFDGGNTWPLVHDFGTNVFSVGSFTQDSSGNLYAVLFNIDASNELQYSGDGGATWNIIADNNDVVSSMSFPELKSKWNRTFLFDQQKLYEIDPTAPDPFTQIPFPSDPIAAGEGSYGLQMDDSGAMYACFNHIYKTTDTGQTWQQIPWANGIINSQNKLNGFYIDQEGTPFVLIKNKDGNRTSAVYWYTKNPLSTGNIDPISASIQVYPNPVTYVLHYTYSNTNHHSGKIIIKVSNLQGQVLQTKETALHEGQLDFSHFLPGIYFVEFKGKEFSKTFKIIKQ